MSKRSRKNESKEERWLRKMKRYEDKLRNRQCYQSDEDNDVQNEEHLENVIYEVVNAEVTDDPPRAGVEQIPCIEDAVNTENAPTPPAPTSEPGPSDTNVVVEDVDPELLKALGDFEAEAVEWGANIQEDVAKRLQNTLQSGLKKEAREELLKKYLFPQNMTFSKAPTLNPEINSMLNEASRNRDKRLLSKQDQIGKALTALGKAMTYLLRKSPDIRVSEVLRIMNDAGKLFADAHYAETETRRSLIIPMVAKSLIDTFKDRKRDSYLFGDKLGDIVKNSRGIKKTGQFIQATNTSTSGTSLNWKGPSSRSRQRPNQPYFNRNGGGQRTQYQYSNRNATRRPPPPTRRQPGAYAPPTTATARRQSYAQAARPPPPPPPPPPAPQ